MRAPRSSAELRNVALKLHADGKFLQGVPDQIALRAVEELIRSIELAKVLRTTPIAPEAALGILLIQAIEKEMCNAVARPVNSVVQ